VFSIVPFVCLISSICCAYFEVCLFVCSYGLNMLSILIIEHIFNTFNIFNYFTRVISNSLFVL
jgi:hypothetical protein